MAEKRRKKNERDQNHIASPTGIANDGWGLEGVQPTASSVANGCRWVKQV